MGLCIFHSFDILVSLRGHEQWFKVKVAVVLFLLLDNVCCGVYEEYDMLEHCGNTIDMADMVNVAGKLKVSSSDYQQLQNCTVTIEPWFKWDHIAIEVKVLHSNSFDVLCTFDTASDSWTLIKCGVVQWDHIAIEVKDYNLNEGACVIVEQGSRYTYSERQILDPLLHICQRGGDALVAEYQLNTNATKRLIVTFVHGTKGNSNFVLRFFAYESFPCGGIACDGDKCLSSVLECDGEYLFGDCATQTWCPTPPPRKRTPEKPFKLTTAHIIGIIGACLAMLQLLYCICRHCLRKLGSSSEEPQEIYLGGVPQDGDDANQNDTDTLDRADERTHLQDDGPDSSSPGAPLNVPPPAYDDVISSDKYNTKYWQP